VHFVAVAACQAAIGGGFAGPTQSFHVDLVDVQIAAAEAGGFLPSRGGERLCLVAGEAESVAFVPGDGPPVLCVRGEQQGALPRSVRVVALEAFPVHAGRVPELARILFSVMALEAEVLDPRGVQPSVEAVAGITPAVGQRAMAPRAEEGGQAGAVRVMTGEAGSTVAADPAVGTEETLIVTVMTPSAQGVAFRHEREPLLVSVIEVAFGAVPVGEGRVNTPVAVTEGSRFMTFVARLGGLRGRGGGKEKGRQEQQDAECSHASILPSFLKGNGNCSGKRTLFLSHECPGNNRVLAEGGD